MKKNSFIVIVIMLCFLMSGCGHTHKGKSEWKADAKNHWHECQSCNELLDYDSHILDDGNYCQICAKCVDVSDDGTYSIYSYDENGALIEESYYDESGSLIARSRYVFEYYEDGNVKSQKNYLYDIAYGDEEFLESESVYSYCTNSEYGDVYESISIYYYEDGSKIISEYTENSYISKVTEYDENGEVVEVETYEYQFNDDNICIYQVVYINGGKNFEEFSELAPDGTPVITKQILYFDNGETMVITYEYEFDDDGNLMNQTTYVNEILTTVDIYEYDEDGWTYLSKSITYAENGDIQEETHYDEEGNVIYSYPSEGSAGQ